MIIFSEASRIDTQKVLKEQRLRQGRIRLKTFSPLLPVASKCKNSRSALQKDCREAMCIHDERGAQCLRWARWVCGGDWCRVESAAYVGRAGEKNYRGLHTLAAIAFPGEAENLWEVHSRGKVLLDKSGWWRQREREREKINACMCVRLYVCACVCTCVHVCSVCVCVCSRMNVYISVSFSSSG